MLLRILLIVTILIGIGAIAVTQFVVRPHVQTIIDVRDKNLKDYQNEKQAHGKTKSQLKDTKDKLALTEKNLDETKTQLTAVTTKATEQEKRANNLDQELGKTKQTLSGVQADLAAWTALGIPVNEVRALIADFKKLRNTNEAIEEEKKILALNLKKAEDKIKALTGGEDDPDPPLPAGLNGRVLVVDPKFDFVVLNIGAKNGVEPRGVLMVSRNSKLVAKVRVATVQPERSIANVMPGWKITPIKEGDQVLVY